MSKGKRDRYQEGPRGDARSTCDYRGPALALMPLSRT